MSTTEQLEGLRRAIKVMSVGQVINREEMGRDKRGYARLHPKYHAISAMPLDTFADVFDPADWASGPSWRDFVPKGFVDSRAEHLEEYTSRMKWKQITHVKMRQIIRGHLLAYAFLRGVPYRAVEPKAFEPPKFDILLGTICNYSETDKVRSEVVVDLADWLLDSTTEVPEKDWQQIDNMRYRLRNLSQAKHAETGLPKYEAMKAEEKKAAKKAARKTAAKKLS